jgi:hypothetical protein
MTHDHDLDAQLRTFFTDADLGVDPRPGSAGQVLAGVRRRRQRRTVAVSATAVAAVSAAGAAIAATGGQEDGEPKVVPATQTPGNLCPAYAYWDDEEAGVGRLFTQYPTPNPPLPSRFAVPTGAPREPSEPVPSSVEPSHVPSDTRTPLPTDRPVPSPPAGCVDIRSVPGVRIWQYGPPSPAPWDVARSATPTP